VGAVRLLTWWFWESFFLIPSPPPPPPPVIGIGGHPLTVSVDVPEIADPFLLDGAGAGPPPGPVARSRELLEPVRSLTFPGRKEPVLSPLAKPFLSPASRWAFPLAAAEAEKQVESVMTPFLFVVRPFLQGFESPSLVFNKAIPALTHRGLISPSPPLSRIILPLLLQIGTGWCPFFFLLGLTATSSASLRHPAGELAPQSCRIFFPL